jgi:hypothetical protein
MKPAATALSSIFSYVLLNMRKISKHDAKAKTNIVAQTTVSATVKDLNDNEYSPRRARLNYPFVIARPIKAVAIQTVNQVGWQAGLVAWIASLRSQ